MRYLTKVVKTLCKGNITNFEAEIKLSNIKSSQDVTRSSATADKQRVSCLHGGRPAPSAPSGYTYAYGRIRNPQQTYVKRAVHKAHFKMNRTFKVIQGHPYWCQQESRTVCCRNVQLMPTLFLKLT